MVLHRDCVMVYSSPAPRYAQYAPISGRNAQTPPAGYRPELAGVSSPQQPQLHRLMEPIAGVSLAAFGLDQSVDGEAVVA
jgi:hypothetical protein